MSRHAILIIIYGPKLLAGAGFVALYVIQGTGQIKLFLRFWRTTGQASRLLKVALGWAQLMAGIYQPILTNTTTPLLHLTVCWSKSLRTFLQFLDAEIELHQDQVLPIQRQYDENVMDRILSSEAFTDKAIKQINNCQLFPQSVTISDLCTACGTRLDPFFLKGETSLLSSTTNWITTNQQRPGEPAWKNGAEQCAYGVATTEPFTDPLALGFILATPYAEHGPSITKTYGTHSCTFVPLGDSCNTKTTTTTYIHAA
jgi:hypothetical protein